MRAPMYDRLQMRQCTFWIDKNDYKRLKIESLITGKKIAQIFRDSIKPIVDKPVDVSSLKSRV